MQAIYTFNMLNLPLQMQPKGRDNFSVSIQRAWNQSLSGCNISVAVVDDGTYE